MGAAFYLTTESQAEKFCVMVDGKALCHATDEVDALAASLGLTPLSEFIRVSEDEMMDFLGDEAEDLLDPEAALADLQTARKQLRAEPKSADRDAMLELVETAEAAFAEGGAGAQNAAAESGDEWFPPAAGLATVRGLLDQLAANPQALANQEMVVADLRALRDALELAKKQGIRWRLSVDI